MSTARELAEASQDMMADLGNRAEELGPENLGHGALIVIASALTAIALTMTEQPSADIEELAARHASLVAKIESLEHQKTELEVAVRAREARLR